LLKKNPSFGAKLVLALETRRDDRTPEEHVIVDQAASGYLEELERLECLLENLRG
jgi:hypothetical protein